MLFVLVLGVVLVGCLWAVGGLRFRSKLALTLLYLASFALLLAPGRAYLFVVAQCVLAAVIGVATFGTDFLGGQS